MTTASGSRHQLSYIAEVTYGTTPNTPAMTPFRHKGGVTLALSKNTFQSEELRSDRQIADYRHGTKQIGGEIPFELSDNGFDDFIEAVLGGTWATKATKTATTISAVAADNSYNDSGNGFVTAGFEVGDSVVVTGFTGNVANNIAHGVLTSVAAGKIIVGGTDGDVIVDDAAGESVTIATLASACKAGVLRRSFTFDQFFSDIAQHLIFRGVEMNTMKITISPNGIVAGSFGVIGQSQITGAIAGASLNATPTGEPYDGFAGSLLEAGAPIAVVTEIALNINNNLATMFVIGSDETLQPSIGRSMVDGTATMYFENLTMLNKFINETESSIQFELSGANRTGIRVTLPRVKYNGGAPNVGGEGPITLQMPFIALYDTTMATQIRVERNF